METINIAPRNILRGLYNTLILTRKEKLISRNMEKMRLRSKNKKKPGRQKLPQSGWAKPRIILLVVKSGRANIPFH